MDNYAMGRMKFLNVWQAIEQMRITLWKNKTLGDTAQRPPDGFARHLLALLPSYFTKMLGNTQSIPCAFCFI